MKRFVLTIKNVNSEGDLPAGVSPITIREKVEFDTVDEAKAYSECDAGHGLEFRRHINNGAMLIGGMKGTSYQILDILAYDAYLAERLHWSLPSRLQALWESLSIPYSELQVENGHQTRVNIVQYAREHGIADEFRAKAWEIIPR